MAYSTTACVVVASLGVGANWILASLRFYVRRFIIPPLRLDDYFAFIALCGYTVISAFYLKAVVEYGFGQHLTPVTNPSDISQALKWFFLAEVIYIPTNTCIKVSFALTLFRIVNTRLHKYALYFAIACIVIMSTVIFFLVLLSCEPVSYIWKIVLDPTGTGGHCRSIVEQSKASYAHGAVILFSDILLGIVIPIHLLSTLQIQRRVKLTTGFLLSLGSLASIATAVRLGYSAKITNSDVLYNLNRPFFWSLIEFATSIFCVSAATLKPLVIRLNLFNSNALSKQGSSHELSINKSFGKKSILGNTTSETMASANPRGKTFTDTNSSTEAINKDVQMSFGAGILQTREYKTTSEAMVETWNVERRELWSSGAPDSNEAWLDIEHGG